MDNTTFRLLNADELTGLYETHMKRDFPKAELKPLKALQTLTEQGFYQSYGLFDADGGLMAYALYWTAGPDHDYVMLDYFAVLPHLRNAGVGSELLGDMLCRFCVDGKGVFGEVEIPDTGDAQVDALRRRRLGFYARAGLRQMGYTTKIFTVPFLVLAYGPDISDDDLMETHRAIYRTLRTGADYDKNIFIPYPPED